MNFEFKTLCTLLSSLLLSLSLGNFNLSAQQVEVQGELKVSQMTPNNTENNLVTRNTDGTLGTRSVSSLPPPPAIIDTSRNLASDFELAKHLCECGTDLPPFLVESLLESGYTEADLLKAGVPASNLNFQCGEDLLDSRDGQFYSTQTIGGQCWMTENLNIGTQIDAGTAQTSNGTLEKYCYDGLASNCDIYGGMYQWNEMMQYASGDPRQGICPVGWHIPSDEEFKTLELNLGMTQVEVDGSGFRGTDQGSQLAGNAALWTDDNLDQNANFGSSGFDAIPGGSLISELSFGIGSEAYFWTTLDGGGGAQARIIVFDNSQIGSFPLVKNSSLSVRCVQN